MEVFLVPVGRGRHALYCEPGDDSPGHVAASAPGFWKRMSERFAEVLDTVEREHDARSHPDAPRPSSMWQRVRGRVMAWMAEKIAEQRLLWRLRGRTQVRALFPLGLEPARALLIVRGNLSRDFDRHRWWLVVDVLGGLVGLALTPIPGPNLLGYYFAFRIVGHFFALRGARQGLPRCDGTSSRARRSRSWRRSTGWRERAAASRRSGRRAARPAPAGALLRPGRLGGA